MDRFNNSIYLVNVVIRACSGGNKMAINNVQIFKLCAILGTQSYCPVVAIWSCSYFALKLFCIFMIHTTQLVNIAEVKVFARPFVLSILSCLSLCDIGLLWPNGWVDQYETWHAGRPRPRPHCVRWGPTSPSPKGNNPQFSAHVCCGKTAGWIKMPLGMEVGPGDIVLDGDPSPPKRGRDSSPPPLLC